MRDYLSRIAKTAGNVVAHPTAARAILARRPAYVAAAFLVVLVTAFAVLRIVRADETNAPVKSDAVSKTSIETTTATSPAAVETTPQPVAEGDQQTMTTPNSENQSSSTSTQTNVTVNGQKVDVPQNGSVSKTIQSDNGTTSVNITNSSSSNTSGGSTSNSLNVSTFSQSTGTNTTQVNRYVR